MGVVESRSEGKGGGMVEGIDWGLESWWRMEFADCDGVRYAVAVVACDECSAVIRGRGEGIRKGLKCLLYYTVSLFILINRSL